MSDCSWDEDEYHQDSRRNTKNRRVKPVKEQRNFLETLMDSSIESSMEKPLFKAIRLWIDGNIGIDLSYLVWAIALCVPVRKYAGAAYDWLSSNLTNSLELDRNDALVTDLLIWISKQPFNQLFAWLPTFEHLEWKDLSHERKTADNDENNRHQLIASAGYTPFFHRGVPFVLFKPDERNYEGEGKLTLRCMWGSKKPIAALLQDVRDAAHAQMTVLNIYRVSAGGKIHDTCRKRKLETIDMNPRKKQELLTDLQMFFAKDADDYYQNGTPYRRGQLFYGPAGTGKTSLSTAIASQYDLPLCVIDIAGMNDTILQNQVQNLPRPCVILFEDIDAAGIVRERTMGPSPVVKTDASDEEEESSDEEEESSSESEPSDSWNPKLKKPKARKQKSKKVDPKKKITAPQPSRTQVTLSGLLNTLDGPGSRENYIVILTTNAPDSLDEALYRPGRIDTQVYLGFADTITAAITFTRIFGTDKEVKVSQQELSRMGRRFGRMLPSDFFTPTEIQKFCMNRRGQPQKALDEFRQYIHEKRTGKTKFQYDIHRRAPQPTFHEKEDVHDDDTSDEAEYTPSSTENSSERAGHTFPSSSRESPAGSSTTWRRSDVREQLFISCSDNEYEDNALAYGEYHPHSQGVWEDRLAGNVADACQGLIDMLTFPSIKPPRYRSAASTESRNSSIRHQRLSWGQYLGADDVEGVSMPNLEPPTIARQPLPLSQPDATFLDESRAASPSPTEITEASAYYTPLSLGEQIEQNFQHHRLPNHSDVVGRRNVHPYHGSLPHDAEGDPWKTETSPKPATVLLRHVDPQPLEGFEKLRLEDDHDTAD